jgi:unsaturated chondroitin disaccharide hydrolase
MKSPIAPGTRTSESGASAISTGARFQEAFDLCVLKTRRNIKDLANEAVPGAWAWAPDGDYSKHKEGFFEIGNWTTSFFTGMALLAWLKTEDEFFLDQVLCMAPHYREKVFNRWQETHHDLGFLATLYSVALYKLTHQKEHREVGLRAADVLAQRFNEKGRFIRAWGRMDESKSSIGNEIVQTDNLAIIDSLMNLPLLYWASNETGGLKYRDIAVRHADTVLKHFVRSDGSVAHALRFDLSTGLPLAADNYCGFNKDSYWARGAAWAIYGFALSYRYTRDEKYRDASIRLAKKFLAQLDEEGVPVWDFSLPPNRARVRDTSASAIAVCGIQELARHEVADGELLAARERLLERLCRGDYLDNNPNCRGVLKSAFGDQPAYSSWGDYFLMEALDCELNSQESFW